MDYLPRALPRNKSCFWRYAGIYVQRIQWHRKYLPTVQIINLSTNRVVLTRSLGRHRWGKENHELVHPNTSSLFQVVAERSGDGNVYGCSWDIEQINQPRVTVCMLHLILERRRRHLGAEYCYRDKIIGRYRPAKNWDGDTSSQLVDAQGIYWLVITWSSSINESECNVLIPTWTRKCIKLPTSAATSSPIGSGWMTLEESKSCMTVISYKPQALHARWTELPNLITRQWVATIDPCPNDSLTIKQSPNFYGSAFNDMDIWVEYLQLY